MAKYSSISGVRRVRPQAGWVWAVAGALLAVAFVQFDHETETQKRISLSAQKQLVSPPLPENLNFCGEHVPMTRWDVREPLELQVLNTLYRPYTVSLLLKRANRYREPMLQVLREEGVPEDFFYLMVAESHIENATSRVGAQGFWQFMPATATEYGLEVNEYVDERNDPMRACRAACRYFRKAYSLFDNWTLVAASYNMGMGGMRYNLNKQGQMNYYDLLLNAETGAYLYRILAYKILLEKPEAYGFEVYPGDLYEPIATREVVVNESISNLVRFARQNGTTYKLLKQLNPWLLKDELPVASNRQYVLSLPA